jgi:hypothetical protein
MTTASAPGENFEVRQTSVTDDWHPDRKAYSDINLPSFSVEAESLGLHLSS